MPSITVSDHTHQLILAQARSPSCHGASSIRLPDGMWRILVHDEVAAAMRRRDCCRKPTMR